MVAIVFLLDLIVNALSTTEWHSSPALAGSAAFR